MVRCGLGMQQCAMHNATIQKATFLELGVYMYAHGYPWMSRGVQKCLELSTCRFISDTSGHHNNIWNYAKL